MNVNSTSYSKSFNSQETTRPFKKQKTDEAAMVTSSKISSSPYQKILGDILAHIFCFLDETEKSNWAVKRVCKWWKAVADKILNVACHNNMLIKTSALNGYETAVAHLLKTEKVDPSAADNFAIQMASENGYFEVVKLLLSDARVDPSANNNYAIRMASKNGHLEVVKLLLSDARVNPSHDNNYAILRASKNGHLEVARELLKDKRVDPVVLFNYPILWAHANGHSEVVKLLLSHKRVNPYLFTYTEWARTASAKRFCGKDRVAWSNK